jgi:hypothetical protein
MSGVTPLNIIVRELKELAQAHGQVRTFAYGHFLDVIKDTVIDYALVHVNIRSANKAENANTFSIELGVMDKTFKDDSNIQDVESNTYQIFIDLFNIISYSPRWQTLGVVTTPANPQKFRYKGADEVTGWGGTIGFEIYEGLGFCDVPVFGYDYDAPVTPVLGPAKYQNSDLTFTQLIDPGDTYTAPDISFTDSDGSVSSVPANKDIVATPCGTTTIFNRPAPPFGQTTNNFTYDEGWHYQNGTYTTGYAQGSGTVQTLDETDLTRETLLYNNEYGNKNRFTDGLGGQNWLSATNDPNDLLNATQDHLTGLEWVNRNASFLGFSNSNWLNNLTNVNTATILGRSDWRVPSIAEINTITNQANVPFNNGTYFRITSTVESCSVRRDVSTQYYRATNQQTITTTSTGSTSTRVALYVRTM